MREPELRILRWSLLIGISARLLLAPLTSWGTDTPSFVAAGTNLVYSGSPYSGLFFNPPLGPFVQAPFLAILSVFVPPTSWVVFVPALGEVARVTGLVGTGVPIPAALLALKLPLIVADVATALGIFSILRRTLGVRMATGAAAAWLFNPLAIWVSSVHGEYDPLAALALVALVWSLERRWAFGSGVALGLGTMAKLVPLAALPLVLVFFALPTGPTRESLRQRLRSLGLLGAGALLIVLPFAPVLAGLGVSLQAVATTPSYGGLSILILFNSAVAGWTHSISPELAALGPKRLLQGLEIVGGIAILAPAVGWALRGRLAPSTSANSGEPALLLLLPMVGVVLASNAPQSENLLEVLPLLLLATPVLGRTGPWAYAVLSAAGIGLYWALLTPLAYFTPLWVAAGPPTLRWADGTEIAYVLSNGVISQGFGWLLTGLLAGVTLLVLWAELIRRMVPIARGREVRSPGSAVTR